MPQIVPVVEGEGEVLAVPGLVNRILAHQEHWDWTSGRARELGNFETVELRLESTLTRLSTEANCAAILLMTDLDDGCPKAAAARLVAQTRTLHLHCPVAIVLAHREYEAWFLASLQTIAGHHDLPAALSYPGEVEARRGVKEWLSSQLPHGKSYRTRIHQKLFTALIDLDLARNNSRSFRRLYHAIDQLVRAATAGERGYVSPLA